MAKQTKDAAEIDTRKHIARVGVLLHRVAAAFLERADKHDASKLAEPEKQVFAVYTAKLAGVTYGSEAYQACLDGMKPALDHHYANNRHHPEHFPGGISDMTLIDLLEALCDWKAASERHHDGNIRQSLEHNRKRFNFGPELASILENTIRELCADA